MSILRRSIVAAGNFSPIACTVTLTGDIGPASGFAAADISGNSFSVTDAAANVYLASTPFATAGVRRPMPAEGKKVWIQGDSFYTAGGGGTNARVGFYAFDAAGSPIALAYVRGGTFGGENVAVSVSVELPVGGSLASALLPQPAFPAYQSFGIDDSGELYIYRADTGQIIAMSDIDIDFSGALAGATTLVLFGLCDLSGGGPASAGARIVTNQADMIDRDFLGGEDWCGNPIGAAFNPVALPDLLAYYDIRQAGTLFQDTAGTTPVSVATDPIGRWDAVGPSGAPNLTQGTAPNRPLYQLTPTRAEFDLLDDSLSVTLPAISGGQIVIVSPAGIWIDSLTFAGGTFTIGPSTYTGGPAGLLSLLSGDVTAVYILDAPLSVDDQAALVAFEAARGSAGLITLGAERVADPSFDNTGYWTQLGAAVVSGGNLSFTNATSGASDACYRSGLTSSGKIYMATATATSVSSGRAELSIGQGTGSAILPGGMTSAGTYRLIGANDSTLNRAPRIANAIIGGEPLNATFSSVSLREVILP